MKYKYYIVSLFLLLLTGCKFEYNVNITSDGVEEDNIAYIENTTEKTVEDEAYKIAKKYSGPTDELGMYKSSVVRKNNLFGVDYFAKYSFDDYQNSPSFSLCYDNYRMARDSNSDLIIISTNEKFKCFDMFDELEELNINIRSEYDVVSSNADNVSNDVYSWYINRNNYNNKSVNIVFSTDIENTDDNSQNGDNTIDIDDGNKNHIIDGKIADIVNQSGAFWVVFFSLVVLGFIILILKFIGKKNNKI